MFWSTAPLRRGRIGPAGLPIIYRVTAHPTSCRRGCWPKKIRCDVTWKCENSLYLCRWPRRGRTRQPRAAALGMWSPLKMLQGPTGRNRSGNGPLGLATQKSNRFPRAAALGYRVWLLRSRSASMPYTVWFVRCLSGWKIRTISTVRSIVGCVLAPLL